jgi:hypothetical protein
MIPMVVLPTVTDLKLHPALSPRKIRPNSPPYSFNNQGSALRFAVTMSSQSLFTHQRRVHLDFHTSPHIPDVAQEFDAQEFAHTFQKANVNSVTVFAKCHHGMCYYPTKTGVQHPALKGRDLLGEQIEALHRVGIKAPIYTTVAWEEDVARHHPDWKMMRRDGSFARVGDGQPGYTGGWWYMNFLHPDYQDYIEAHVREIMANYEVDGLFFDILMFDRQSCWSDASVKFRQQHGLMDTGPETQALFETTAQNAFAARFTRIVRGVKPDATIFYNSTTPLYTDTRAGIRERGASQSHWELESLPSGSWGYHHFPRLARAMGNWGKPWLGMTGRFQRMWGDFGGLKPQAALEYECFRTQALGGANSIGDQLPPRGKLDAGAYDLIGSVFSQCAAAEPFYDGSTPLPQIGIVAPGALHLDSEETDQSLEGAIQLCEGGHYDSAVLDEASELSGYELVVLPDSVVLTPTLRKKLLAYMNEGGKLLLSGHSGFGPHNDHELCLPLRIVSDVEKFPSYWRAASEFSPVLSRSDRVVYQRGLNVQSGPQTEVLVQRVLPYFQRSDRAFCSHFQTPPQSGADAFPAVIAGAGFIYFADPIFREYRRSGNTAVSDGWKAAVARLIGPAPFGEGLPSTVLAVPRRRGDDLLLTLLHYIPTRKSLEIDTIEERSSFAGELLQLPQGVTEVIDFETGAILPRECEAFVLPDKKGRLLLEVRG